MKEPSYLLRCLPATEGSPFALTYKTQSEILHHKLKISFDPSKNQYFFFGESESFLTVQICLQKFTKKLKCANPINSLPSITKRINFTPQLKFVHVYNK
jgi:hypothetical protein